MDLDRFIAYCDECIRARDGNGLCMALRADSHASKMASMEHLQRPPEDKFRRLPGEYGTFVERLLNARGAVAAKEWYDAFSLHSKAMQALFREYDNLSNDNWLCGPIIAFCTEHRIFAHEAFEEANRSQTRVDTLSLAEETIRKFFRKSVQDKTEDLSRSKKKAVLALAVQLFKIHFKLNTLNLCTDVTRLIESMILGTIDFETFLMAHKVAYSYFVGRLALYDENFHEADRNLTYAYERCPNSAIKNKRQIAQFLLCARLNTGLVPSQQFLHKYSLSQFSDIVSAVRTRGIETNQWYFISKGMYLAMERLQKIVFRSLARRIFLLLQPSKGTRIPLLSFEQVVEQIGANIDEDEMECILVNLIYEGLMKGYISHKRKMLVLSNQTAFPSMSSVFASGH